MKEVKPGGGPDPKVAIGPPPERSAWQSAAAFEGEYVPYYGYWSFEAAAVCVIHDIDDSSFRDHLLYPKDLADWARANRSLERLKPGA